MCMTEPKARRTFADKVHDVTRAIPRGRTLTYSEVARRAGSPGAARAVGSILAKNFNPRIPCHRVIRADGGMGGYNRGIENKKCILKEEGVL